MSAIDRPPTIEPLIHATDLDVGFAIVEFEGVERLRNRSNVNGAYLKLRGVDGEISRVVVGIGARIAQIADYTELPGMRLAEQHLYLAYAVAAVAEAIDAGNVPKLTPDGGAATLYLLPEPRETWILRKPPADSTVFRYLTNKMRVAWRLGTPCRVSPSDCIRLHAPLTAFYRAALIGQGREWTTIDDGTLPGLTPTPNFARSLTPEIGASSADIREQLSAPRYRGTLEAWNLGLAAASADAPNLAQALHHHASSVEALARTVAGSSATLGEIIKQLKHRRRLSPNEALVLNQVWGFASNEPSVRHGSPQGSSLERPKFDYWKSTCENALKLLLALDRLPMTEPTTSAPARQLTSADCAHTSAPFDPAKEE